MKPIKGYGKRNKRNLWKKKEEKEKGSKWKKGNNFMHFDEKSSQGFFEFTDLELISRHLNVD